MWISPRSSEQYSLYSQYVYVPGYDRTASAPLACVLSVERGDPLSVDDIPLYNDVHDAVRIWRKGRFAKNLRILIVREIVLSGSFTSTLWRNVYHVGMNQTNALGHVFASRLCHSGQT